MGPGANQDRFHGLRRSSVLWRTWGPWLGLLAGFGVVGWLVWVAGGGQVWDRLRGVSLSRLAMAVLVFGFAWVFRTLRITWLVRVFDGGISAWKLFRVSISATALNAVLPARVGDLAGVFMLHRLGVTLGRCLAVLLQARLLDAAAMVMVALVSARMVFAGPGIPEWVWPGVWFGMVVLVLPIAVVLMDRRRWTVRLAEWVARRLPDRLGELGVEAAREGYLAYAELISSPRLWMRLMAVSAGVGTLEAAATCLVAWAVGAEMSCWSVALAMSLGTLGKSSAATPGGVGLYEGVFSGTLVALGYPLDAALTVALLDHGLKKGLNLVVGLPCLASFRNGNRLRDREERRLTQMGAHR